MVRYNTQKLEKKKNFVTECFYLSKFSEFSEKRKISVKMHYCIQDFIFYKAIITKGDETTISSTKQYL